MLNKLKSWFYKKPKKIDFEATTMEWVVDPKDIVVTTISRNAYYVGIGKVGSVVYHKNGIVVFNLVIRNETIRLSKSLKELYEEGYVKPYHVVSK